MSSLADLVAPARLGRNFRWLLASSWVTNLGDGITLAAGPLLVASQTHNPLVIAMAALLQRLPWLMFGLYAGVVADRINRRAIVITTGLARMVILLLLTASILTHRVDTAVVLAALFLFGVNETFGDTTTTTLLPMLVGKRDLGIANSRTFTGVIVWNQMAGPPIGRSMGSKPIPDWLGRSRPSNSSRRSTTLRCISYASSGSLIRSFADGFLPSLDNDTGG